MVANTYLPEGIPLPAPDPSGFDAPFWEHAKKHELVVQRCTQCGTLRHTPEVSCWKCRSFDFDWAPQSGRGAIYSHMNIVYPAHPALKERVPFNVVLVELENAQGIRMVGNLVDTPYDEIRIGMPVEVHWEDRPEAEDVTLPLWKRAGA